jgi:sulfur transfer complex TusBCD TusB component (DsrH family)
MTGGNGRHDDNGPVDVADLTALRVDSAPRVMESELDVVMVRGVSFPYVALNLYAQILCGVFAALVAWAGTVTALGDDTRTVARVTGVLFVLVAAAGFAWMLYDWRRRADRVVVDDHGMSLWQGRSRRLTIGWDALKRVRKVWPGITQVSSRNGTSIWITSSFERYEFLAAFAARVCTLDRPRDSLREIILTAMKRGIVFRYDVATMHNEVAWAVWFFAIGAVIVIGGDRDIRALVGVVIFAVLALFTLWLASLTFRRRKDEIVLSSDGVESRSRGGRTFISWAEMAHPEAIDGWAEGEDFFARDASGQKVISDMTLLHDSKIARLLLQFMLFREMKARGMWARVDALDALNL